MKSSHESTALAIAARASRRASAPRAGRGLVPPQLVPGRPARAVLLRQGAGFYAEEGIDLTINEGRGSANTVQVVAAGSDTFGLADSSVGDR